jgi:hypothetical protein
MPSNSAYAWQMVTILTISFFPIFNPKSSTALKVIASFTFRLSSGYVGLNQKKVLEKRESFNSNTIRNAEKLMIRVDDVEEQGILKDYGEFEVAHHTVYNIMALCMFH